MAMQTKKKKETKQAGVRFGSLARGLVGLSPLKPTMVDHEKIKALIISSKHPVGGKFSSSPKSVVKKAFVMPDALVHKAEQMSKLLELCPIPKEFLN